MNAIKGSLTGIHHITSGVSGAQEDVDFFTKILGQRMIKQTVLFDGENPVYHLYYGSQDAQAGSIMTTLPFKDLGYKGRKGSGQISAVAYAIPPGSMAFWEQRLSLHLIKPITKKYKFGAEYIEFEHPSGLVFELTESEVNDIQGWVTDEIHDDHAIRGIFGVTLSVRDYTEQARFFTDGLKMTLAAEDGAYQRFHIGVGGPQRTIDVLYDPSLPQGTWGFAQGIVHHIAFAVETEKEQLEIKEHLVGLGFPDVSEIKDRNYFHSIYVRSPGGILIEFATSDIGFCIDETPQALGSNLMIPPWWKDKESEFMDKLEKIKID